MRHLPFWFVIVLLTGHMATVNAQTLASLEQLAVEYSPQYRAAKEQAQTKYYMALTKSSLSDPQVSIGLMNVPTNSLELDQEAMTQKKISLTQMLPRGLSLRHSKQMGLADAKSLTEQAENIKAKIILEVRQAWLALASLKTQLKLLNEQKALRTELVATVHKLLANGQAKQRDVLMAQLQLGRIGELLIEKDHEMKQRILKVEKLTGASLNNNEQFKYPKWKIINSPFDQYGIDKHPLTKAAEAKIQMSQANLDLAKAQYYPAIGINLSYAKRENNPSNGQKRADFISGMLTFELPIYFMSKQSNSVESAKASRQAANFAQQDLILELKRQTLEALDSIKAEKQKLHLYDKSLMKTAQAAYQATLLGYNNNLNTIRDVIDSDSELLSVKLKREVVNMRLYQAMANYRYLTGEQS